MKSALSPFLLILLIGITLILIISPRTTSATGQSCPYIPEVCTARSTIFPISAFDPLASAVRIGPETLVTTRHSIADKKNVSVFLPNGQSIIARAIPTDLPGDLMLLKTTKLPDGPVIKFGKARKGDKIRSVAIDLKKRKVKVYKKGVVTFLPTQNQVKARLHHTAYSQPGNSGGALINKSGELIGIIASGGEDRYEAIPTSKIFDLKKRSGELHRSISDKIGQAIRMCTLKLEDIQNGRLRQIKKTTALFITKYCSQSTNRQLYDLAANKLGVFGFREASIKLFEKSLSEDENAVNSRIGLIVSLSMSTLYKDAIPHIRWLLDQNINDLQILRFGVQCGIWGGDKSLANDAFARLKIHHPAMAPTAQKFLDNPPPRPKRRN